MELLGWAGDYSSLEEMLFEKLTGPPMGWRPEDRERALAAIHFTLLEEGTRTGDRSYAEHFREAYGADLSTLGIEEAVELAARALADYVRSLESTRTAPWDAFAEQNRIRPAPNPGEPAANYSFGVFSRIGNQESRRLIKRPKGFSREAYEGFKIFFRTFPDQEGEPVGNCVVCHVPPHFTDFAFHNKGISELDYERLHGEGAAARYRRPSAPTPATAAIPEKGDPSKIDLGRWNVAPEEKGAIGAFKTPTLRNLSGSDPYMHNGAYATLEEAVAEIVRVSELARAGKLPNADPEVEKIELDQDDVAPLVAFLRQLNEVDPEEFRRYLIELADD